MKKEKVFLNESLTILLKKKGIKKIFSVPGGAIFHIYNALCSDNYFEVVSLLNEQSCMIAAEAYYKITNKVAVVLVTSGPGISNTATGILSSYVDHIPILVICGNAQSKYLKYKYLRSYAPQGISAKTLFNGITNNILEFNKKSKLIDVSNIINLVNKKPYGPCILQIPLDLQRSLLTNIIEKQKNKNYIIKNNTSISPKIDTLIYKSNFPVFLFGGGCCTDDARKQIKKISKKFDIPITLTWTAKDLLNHDNNKFCGLPGYFCNRSANTALYYSDLIIVVGSKLDLLQTGYNFKEFKNKKIKILYVNDNFLELKKFLKDPKFINLKLDSFDFLKYFYLLNRKEMNYEKSWSKNVRSYYIKTINEMVNKNSNKNVNPYFLISEISKLNTDIYIAGSSGGSAEISFLNYYLTNNTKFVNSPGLGSMGFAIPSIVGAVEANINNKIICVVGDGGLQWNIQELATISKYNKSKILIIILNNGGYDSMRRSLKRYFGKAKYVGEESGLKFPNLRYLSIAYDLKYKCIKSNSSLFHNINKIWSNVMSPTILNIITEKNVDSFPKVKPKMNVKGEIVSGSLIELDPEISQVFEYK